MAYFDMIDSTDFITDYSLKTGELATEYTMNTPTLRLKKEVNNVYNVLNILHGNNIIPWRNVEKYIVGDLVQYNNIYYRAKRDNVNKQPDNFASSWEIVQAQEFSNAGTLADYLNKNNNTPYTPINDYNPSTKKYVDDSLLNYMLIGTTAADLNYFVRRGTYNTSSSANTPGTGDFILTNLGNDSKYLQIAGSLDTKDIKFRYYNGTWDNWDKISTESQNNVFTGSNTFKTATVNNLTSNISSIKSLNASNVVISGDLTVNGKTTTLNTAELTVKDKNIVLSDTTNPTDASADGGGITIKGTTDKSITYSAAQDAFIFNPGIVANMSGNAATSSKWLNSITLSLGGDVLGTTNIDGSGNVDMSVAVVNDSHTHNTQYYSKNIIDSDFLRKDINQHPTADNSISLGNSSYKYKEIYATNFYGTSSSAKYADLAEIYTCSESLESGTIVTIDKESNSQVRICMKNEVPFGVVSDKPGYLLNSGVKGVPVALTGQVYVKISGKIHKGDPITILDNGEAVSCDYTIPCYLIIGRALETGQNNKILCAVSI